MSTTMRQFRTASAKFGLERTKCGECGRIDDPTAERCYYCGADDLEAVTLSTEGTVLTVVVQHHLPEEFDTPLPLAIVETPEGGNLLGQFVAVEDPYGIDIGDDVAVEIRRFTREDGEVLYEPKFRPVESGGDADGA